MLFALGHALICVIRGGIDDDRPQCRDGGHRAGASQLALSATSSRSFPALKSRCKRTMAGLLSSTR